MMAVIGTLAYNFSVILPLFAHVFHGGGGTYSAITTAMGIGALVGALIAAARRRPSYTMLVLVTVAFGVFAVAVAMAPSLPLMMLLMVPMGTGSVLFIATANSLLQLHSSDAMRGRVMALWAMVFLGSTPIGGPLTGLVAAHVGVRLTMALGAAATLLTAAGAGIALRRIRRGREAAAAVGGRETPSLADAEEPAQLVAPAEAPLVPGAVPEPAAATSRP